MAEINETKATIANGADVSTELLTGVNSYDRITAVTFPAGMTNATIGFQVFKNGDWREVRQFDAPVSIPTTAGLCIIPPETAYMLGGRVRLKAAGNEAAARTIIADSITI